MLEREITFKITITFSNQTTEEKLTKGFSKTSVWVQTLSDNRNKLEEIDKIEIEEV